MVSFYGLDVVVDNSVMCDCVNTSSYRVRCLLGISVVYLIWQCLGVRLVRVHVYTTIVQMVSRLLGRCAGTPGETTWQSHVLMVRPYSYYCVRVLFAMFVSNCG